MPSEEGLPPSPPTVANEAGTAPQGSEVSVENSAGSGVAVNAGIDYQQRVSAWFLTLMFAQSRISPLFALPHDLTINSIAYENADYVDDLKLVCTDTYTVYLQIKRRLSLSATERSDFRKAMSQFVRQFIAARDPNECYILATSSKSSGAITGTLKKLTEAYRLNPEAAEENPLSKAERRALNTYRDLVKELYCRNASTEMTETDFAAFSKRLYVHVLDVESGGAHENLAITILTPILRVSPELIWALLIKNSLHYAKSRISVTREELLRLLDLYREIPGNQAHQEPLSIDEKWKLAAMASFSPSVGKEVVLIDSFVPSADYLIITFFRFDEKCNKRIRFTGSTAIWGPDNEESKVICRMATETGMNRFVEENKTIFKDKSVAIIEANSIAGVEETPCSQLHAELCKQLLLDRKEIGKCLHCGKPLSQYWVTLVELDDAETCPAVGGVHDECRRAVDRVLGRLNIPFFEQLEFLKCFDIDKWVEHRIKGQGLFNGLRKDSGRFGPITTIAWNAENEDLRRFDYCLRMRLKDGSVRYVTSRGKLDRYRKHVADERAAEANGFLVRARARNDPCCYTSINWTFGSYSRLISIKEDDEECIECMSAEVVQYTEQIGLQYASDTQWYAPLLYLVVGDNEESFVLKDHLVFLTSPLEVGKTLHNWEEAQITVGPYEVRIVESDRDFDQMVAAALRSGLGVVVDPLLDRNGRMVKGHVVIDVESARQTSETMGE
jgi:hypothetical protein